MEYYNGSQEEEWVQVFRGIYQGLGDKDTDFKECVEDGNKTVAAFKKSFQAFEDGQVRIQFCFPQNFRSTNGLNARTPNKV